MHSDREKLVERLKSYGEPCSFDNYSGTLFRFDSGAKFFLSDEDVSAIAALSEPVKDEPVACWHVGEWGDGSTKPGEAVIFCDAHEAAIAAGAPSHLAKMIVEAHNDTLRHNIADAARALLDRPPELRGPFKTDEDTLRKIAGLPPRKAVAHGFDYADLERQLAEARAEIDVQRASKEFAQRCCDAAEAERDRLAAEVARLRAGRAALQESER